ncbi:hypothetical protein [Microcoleus sp. PH2017_02_FOX_O_A]|uniref:hypothetical protein n=1 Tax=Microcoleus sp. PH2017_02_FOX_O_A TaxID=2798813 RepID=UPI001D53DF3D|nr:hypothetical protein [Microcoleus sp. PH2017_02_FOX_O_A]MCC3412380.1 hypothetical protein [Microcoleus sp. PH2017_02_FOX_O_A]
MADSAPDLEETVAPADYSQAAHSVHHQILPDLAPTNPQYSFPQQAESPPPRDRPTELNLPCKL